MVFVMEIYYQKIIEFNPLFTYLSILDMKSGTFF